jgi:hypothetical protein
LSEFDCVVRLLQLQTLSSRSEKCGGGYSFPISRLAGQPASPRFRKIREPSAIPSSHLALVHQDQRRTHRDGMIQSRCRSRRCCGCSLSHKQRDWIEPVYGRMNRGILEVLCMRAAQHRPAIVAESQRRMRGHHQIVRKSPHRAQQSTCGEHAEACVLAAVDAEFTSPAIHSRGISKREERTQCLHRFCSWVYCDWAQGAEAHRMVPTWRLTQLIFRFL